MAVQALTAGPYISSRKGHEFHVNVSLAGAVDVWAPAPWIRPSHSSVYTIQIATVSTHLRKQDVMPSAIRWRQLHTSRANCQSLTTLGRE